MSLTSLSAVRLVEAVVCLSRIPVGCPSGGGCGVSFTSLLAVLVEAEVCLSRYCLLSVWWRLRCVWHVPVGCPSGGG